MKTRYFVLKSNLFYILSKSKVWKLYLREILHQILLSQVSQPLSPTAEEFNDLDDLVAKKKQEQEKRPLVDYEIEKDVDPYKELRIDKRIFKYIFDPLSINPQSWQMTFLMGIQTIVMMYNAWAIPFGLCFTFYRVICLHFTNLILAMSLL